MEKKIIMAGFGGQGVMAMGQLTTYAGMIENKHVSWMPSYGPEMRGGSANCAVVVSDEPVGAPVISVATDAIVMNQPSYEKFSKMVEPGGNLFVNSDLVHPDNPRKDINIYEIPVNEIAIELGNPKVANMVMLGAFIKVTEIVKEDSILQAFTKVYGDKKKKLIPLNQKALEMGQAHIEAPSFKADPEAAKAKAAKEDKGGKKVSRTPQANLVGPDSVGSYLQDRTGHYKMTDLVFDSDISMAKEALLNETEGINFYLMAAEQFKNTSAGKVFKSLAKQEEEHVMYLERLCAKLEGREVEVGKVEQVPKEVIKWDKLEPAMASMALSVFSVGMNLESQSVDFYGKAAERTKDEEAKKLYKELIYWENFHYEQLKGQYDLYKEMWWSDQSFSPF